MNNVKRLTVLALVMAGCAFSPVFAGAIAPTPSEMAEARQFSSKLGGDSADQAPSPCFSFTYDGQSSEKLLDSWGRKESTRELDRAHTERTVTWTDPKTGLEVRRVSVEYSDFPVVEWTVYFKNAGKTDTPILSDIQGMDVSFRGEGDGGFVLRSIRGDDCSAASYQPAVTNIGKGTTHRFAPSGGRPTDGAFPYFNLEWAGQGVIAAIGWPGRWAAQFDCDQASMLTIRGGQELTRLKLLPGEEIRTTLSVLVFWKGDAVRSQNLWRRWMIAHNIPRANGKLPRTFLSGMGPSGIALLPNASAEIAAIDAHQKAGAKHDYWWIDAGWYPCKGSWPNVGTWEPDPARFPKGVKEVSDYAHSRGMKFVLWFEPEAASRPDTWLTTNHPQWILGGEKGGLLNLGNPEARQWVIEHFCRLIKEQGVDLYREDFNIDPLGYWRGNDAPDRQGITENLYVQGHLAYWDELRRRFPDNLIDSCASGGRRNDLETLRRAVPLLRSDYYSATQPGKKPAAIMGSQGQTYGLSFWVPYYGIGVFCEDVYDVRSHITPELGIASLPFSTGKGPISPLLGDRMADWRAVVDEFYGDYYPLTEYSLSEDEWMAWQFNRPEVGSGMVQAFRRRGCPDESIRVKLQGLDREAVYAVTNLDVPGATEMTGRELSEVGLAVAIKEQPGAALITYKKKP